MIRRNSNLIVLVITLLSVILGGSLIVTSQVNQSRVEISSTSGIKPKPENLKVPSQNGNQQNKNNNNLLSDIPDEVTYRQIFKHIEELNKKADKEEQEKGKDGKKLRNLYKQMARLDENQARTLDRIASQANRELKKLDARARQIIDQIRALTPNRKIERGQTPPLPPQELFDLAKQRKEITINAINDLQKSLGPAEFIRFTQFINEKVKPGIKKRGTGEMIQKGGPSR